MILMDGAGIVLIAWLNRVVTTWVWPRKINLGVKSNLAIGFKSVTDTSIRNSLIYKLPKLGMTIRIWVVYYALRVILQKSSCKLKNELVLRFPSHVFRIANWQVTFIRQIQPFYKCLCYWCFFIFLEIKNFAEMPYCHKRANRLSLGIDLFPHILLSQ